MDRYPTAMVLIAAENVCGFPYADIKLKTPNANCQIFKLSIKAYLS
jgi:hypothetical protein